MMLIMAADPTPPESVTFPNLIPVPKRAESPSQAQDYVNSIATERTPEIRMLEQTIVCLDQLNREGFLSPLQKAQLEKLIAQHQALRKSPKLMSAEVAAA
jgi:hypothetical protein